MDGQDGTGGDIKPGIFNNLTYFDYSETDLRDAIPKTGMFFPSKLENIPVNTYGYVCLPSVGVPTSSSYNGSTAFSWETLPNSTTITTNYTTIRYAYFDLDPDRCWGTNENSNNRTRLFIYFLGLGDSFRDLDNIYGRIY